LKKEVEIAKGWKGVYPEEIRHYALLEDPMQGGMEREKWLIDNRNNIEQGSKDWRDVFELDKREKLERRLREINIEVIRYGHDNHIEIESYFEKIYNKKRGVQDFLGNEL
jgi:hypothetical protein